MRKLTLLLLLIIAMGCKTTQINNNKYKVSSSAIELGSIGHAISYCGLKNDFSIHALPELATKIRLDVQVMPFNEKINSIYIQKAKERQLPVSLNYIDSLPAKPEYVTFSIMDFTGFAGELNAVHNKGINNFIKDTKNPSVITSVALSLPEDVIGRIKQADTYYLVNNQDKKYTVAIYKQGKKQEEIDLGQGLMLAYTTGKFCWSADQKQNWYIGDIVKDDKSCPGNTRKYIRKKNDNLFRM